MTRRPLTPWSRASTSISQSHVFQNGLPQRSWMKAKFTRSTPSSSTCMIRTCPTVRNSSTMPEIRMKSQVQSSKPRIGRLLPAPGGFPPGSGGSGRASGDGAPPVVCVGAPADHRRVHDVGEQEEDDRDTGNTVEEPAVLALVALVERAELTLPFGLGVHRSSAYRRSAAPKPGGSAQPIRTATITPSRVGT